MSAMTTTADRLSLWQAAYVVARRDFVAIMFSRAFFFFLLGPLFPILIGTLAAGIGQKVQQATGRTDIAVAMAPADVDAMLRARRALEPTLGPVLPEMVELKRLAPGEPFDAKAALAGRKANIAAVLTGTPAHPVLTATAERAEQWKGAVSLVAANALSRAAPAYPAVETATVTTSGASERAGQVHTAQASLTLLFIVTIFLTGMVMSTLIEEKANKIIEVLAAAIPMDAVFLGKLLAMFLISMVGVVVWGSVIGGLVELAGMNPGLVGGMDVHDLPTPGVGWPLFLLFAVVYFTMNYLLIGAVYLTIGSIAATVREVQTLSMPATMGQIVVFFLATLALADPGGPLELAGIAFPLSSPYTMLARAAVQESLWPHLLAIGWQIAWVAVFIRVGARLFRRKVMKSGPRRVKQRRARRRAADQPAM
ncbi:MAG TPA: ABC transporter permease [Sphingomonadaceae bacterium]